MELRTFRLLLLITGLGAYLLLPARPEAESNTTRDTESAAGVHDVLSDTDRDFIVTAAEGGMAEVEAGRLAVHKGAHHAVKKFGQRMTNDHAASNKALQQLAASKGIPLPVPFGQKHKALLDRLRGLSGADFDRAYMAAMVDDHDKDFKACQQAADTAADADIKAFAGTMLPTLKQHLQMARDIAHAVGAPLSPLAGKV